MTDDQKPTVELDDLTRRQWLLRLGELVALAGVSGLLPDAVFAAAQPAQQHAAQPAGS